MLSKIISLKNEKANNGGIGKMPPYFYFTDNILTTYDFTRYGRESRARITYGNAEIVLPDDLHLYEPEPN